MLGCLHKSVQIISPYYFVSTKHPRLGAFSLCPTLKQTCINIYFKTKTCLLSRIKCIVYSYLNKGVPCRVVCI